MIDKDLTTMSYRDLQDEVMLLRAKCKVLQNSMDSNSRVAEDLIARIQQPSSLWKL